MGRLTYQKPKNPAAAASNSGGSLLWTLLVCGLMVTLVNVFYEAASTLGRLHDSRFDPVQGKFMNRFDQKNSHPKEVEKPGGDPNDESSTTEQDVTWDSLDDELKKDKGPILELVRDAGLLQSVDLATLKRLPSWSQVTELYGEKPMIRGLNDGTCQKFQNSPNASWHFVSTAGTFNTGTNLMAELLLANCHMPLHEKLPKSSGGQGVRWQVLWGKHTPVDDEDFRLTHRTYKDHNLKAEYMFPAVMVRDPFKWMQSMCRHPYGAIWKHDDDKLHCPNLLTTGHDGSEQHPVNVTVKYAEFSKHHSSLVDFWNEWYKGYFEAPFPRLIIRFEDLIYYPREVVKSVCECAGGELFRHAADKFHYVTDSAKKGDAAHGDKSQRTSYLDALIRYGTKDGRYKGYTSADLEYANAHLNEKYMSALSYQFPEEPELEAGT